MASGVRRIRRSCSGSSGALAALPLLFRHLSFSKFSPTFTRLSSSIPPSTLSRSLSNFPKLFLQSFTSPGKRLLPGCFAGIGMAAAIICHPPTTAYAMDDYKVESSGGDVTEDFDTLWALARKYQLPLVMLVMLLLGWRHPLITAINAVFFLFSTRPSPFSIYLVVEHLRRREMQRDPSLSKTKLLYTRKIEVEDYRLFCCGKVELQDRKLHLVGILGGWWIFHVSYN